MKHQLLKGSILLCSFLAIACQNTTTTNAETATDTTTAEVAISETVSETISESIGQQEAEEQALPLPPIKGDEEISFEDDRVRVVLGPPEGLVSPLYIQPKKTPYKAFKIEGERFSFEKVIGNALLASEGGVIRTLLVYDLTTGERMLKSASLIDMEIEVENEHQFCFYRYDNALPQVSWNEEKGVWEEVNQVPAALQNADLAEAKEKSEGDLYDGLVLMAYQKVRVDLKKRKATALKEYKWGTR